MTRFLTLLIALLCACCPVQAPKVVAELTNDTVALVDDDGSIYCAGVWVGPHEILTAAHCVATAGVDHEIAKLFRAIGFPWDPVGHEVLFETYDDSRAEKFNGRTAIVKKYDVDDDLALVETTGSLEHPWAIVRSESLPVGEEVHVIGHPLGEFSWTYVHGYVSSHRLGLDFDDRKVDRLQINVLIHPGNSGGGAFDARGHLVGICSFTVTGRPGLGFFVGQELIARFLHV